jgi:hypothetical protein
MNLNGVTRFTLTLYLSCSKCQRSGKEEISIGRTSVDPQVPKDGTKDRSYQENTTDDERVPKICRNVLLLKQDFN